MTYLRERSNLRQHLRGAVLELINRIVQLDRPRPRLVLHVPLPRFPSRLIRACGKTPHEVHCEELDVSDSCPPQSM